MSARRHEPAPPTSCTPRAAVNPEFHQAVDLALKQLKQYSRRSTLVVHSLEDELHVLERLYYKSKSQHRSSVFWQRFAEVRKYGRRLIELRVSEVIETIRRQFWGPSASDPKAMKLAWSHTPSSAQVKHVLERLSAAAALIHKARERSLKAFEYFTLAMKTAYFLPLVLTFAAITGRMDHLCVEMQECCAECNGALHGIISVTSPAAAADLHPVSEGQMHQRTHLSRPESAQGRPGDPDTQDEDLGAVVSRTSQLTDHPVAAVTACQSRSIPVVPALGPRIAHQHAEPNSVAAVANPMAGDDAILNEQILSSSKVTVVVAKRKQTATINPLPKGAKKLKAKEKRDEIDDIFGF